MGREVREQHRIEVRCNQKEESKEKEIGKERGENRKERRNEGKCRESDERGRPIILSKTRY